MTIRVVIVDDEPLARLAVEVRLARRDGFTLVGQFGDGDSACQGIAALKPDLLFIDVEMPGKTGLEVLASLPSAQRPMAILLTATTVSRSRPFNWRPSITCSTGR